MGELFFANLVGSIHQKASLNMFWEHSPYSTIIASDWLRAELSCGWRKIKMDDGVTRFFLHSLWREFVYLLTCGRRSLVSETQNEIVVSWIILWGMTKIYWLDLTWLDFSLHFRSCCLLHVCCKFGPKLASHLGRSLHLRQLRMK